MQMVESATFKGAGQGTLDLETLICPSGCKWGEVKVRSPASAEDRSQGSISDLKLQAGDDKQAWTRCLRP